LHMRGWTRCSKGIGRQLALVVACAFVSSLKASGPAIAADDGFFKGRALKVVVGSGVGESYDLYSRALADYIPKHLPGSPTMVVQNVTGSAGATGFLNVLSSQPRDGSVIGSSVSGIPTRVLMGDAPPEIEVLRVGWIGSMTSDQAVGVVWNTAPATTLEEMKTKQVIMGALGASGSSSSELPFIANELFGFKIKVVPGYNSTPELVLAMQRGEIHGIFSTTWSSFSSANTDLLKEGKVKVFVQHGYQKMSQLPDTPLFVAEAKTLAQRQVLNLFLDRHEYGEPFFLPPDVPADRLNTWRRAFDATMKDPDFLEGMRSRRLEVNGPKTGEEVSKLISDLYQSPPSAIAQVKQMLAKSREGK
jgi:tripartite-type tricarboxylate transporter receptor subunit TctC